MWNILKGKGTKYLTHSSSTCLGVCFNFFFCQETFLLSYLQDVVHLDFFTAIKVVSVFINCDLNYYISSEIHIMFHFVQRSNELFFSKYINFILFQETFDRRVRSNCVIYLKSFRIEPVFCATYRTCGKKIIFHQKF